MAKTAMAFRLSEEVRGMIEALAERLGVSKTTAVELAIREMTEREDAAALAIYEGEGEALLTYDRAVPVRFRIVQAADGDFDARCTLTGGRQVSGSVMGLTGITTDGWYIKAECHPLNYFAFDFPWQETGLRVRTIEASRASIETPSSVTVNAALLNFVFPDHSEIRFPRLTWRGKSATITPVPGYANRIDYLERFNGKRQTATLQMNQAGNQSIGEVRDHLLEIQSPLSLAAGRLIAIPLIEVRDEEDNSIARWHGDVIVHPFRTQADGLGLTSNPVKLVKAWHEDIKRVFDLAYLRRHIHQYIDCLMTDLFLDSRAILTVAFLDALVTDYYERRHPELTRKKIKDTTFFLDRLEYMAHELSVDLSQTPQLCAAVRDSRNSLIHEAEFAKATNTREKLAQAVQAQWLACAFLVKLLDSSIQIRPMFDARAEEPGFNPDRDLDL